MVFCYVGLFSSEKINDLRNLSIRASTLLDEEFSKGYVAVVLRIHHSSISPGCLGDLKQQDLIFKDQNNVKKRKY